MGEAYCRYQPCNEGIYPIYFCARPGSSQNLPHRIGLPKLCYSYVEDGGRDRT